MQEDIKETPVVEVPTTPEIEEKEKEVAPKSDKSEQERIDSIIESRLAREREKFAKQLEEEKRLAQLSEEERKVELTRKYELELKERESRIKIAENKLEYSKKFESEGLPVDMLDYIVDEDPKTMENKYNEFKNRWQENMNRQLEERIKPKTDPTAFNVNSNKAMTLKRTL
jgi:hypothetical protein